MLFKKQAPSLNELELGIYKYIVNNIEKVPYMTIRELALESHTNPATIFRFCQKFDSNGYSEFKFKLKAYLEEQKNKTTFDLDESILINFLKRSNESLIEERINEAVNILKKKDFIIFMGEGSSRIIANYGEVFFSSFYAVSGSISHLFTHPISKIKKETADKICVIALSVSGQSTKICANLAYFAELGIESISITNSDKCPVSEISTVNIPYYVGIEKNNSAIITSQVPALFLLEKLGKSIASQLNIE